MNNFFQDIMFQILLDMVVDIFIENYQNMGHFFRLLVELLSLLYIKCFLLLNLTKKSPRACRSGAK